MNRRLRPVPVSMHAKHTSKGHQWQQADDSTTALWTWLLLNNRARWRPFQRNSENDDLSGVLWRGIKVSMGSFAVSPAGEGQ